MNSAAGVSTKTQGICPDGPVAISKQADPEEALRGASNQIDQIAQSPNWGNMGGSRIRTGAGQSHPAACVWDVDEMIRHQPQRKVRCG